MMFCKVCGNQLDNGSKFCPKCGSVVNDNGMVDNVNNNYGNNLSTNNQVNNYNNNNYNNSNGGQKKSKNNFIVIGVVVGVLLLVIIGSIQINNWYKDFTKEINDIWDDNNNGNNFNNNNTGGNGYLDNNDRFVAENVKEYLELGYMRYSVPDCWTYDDNTSAKYQYKNSVFVYKDNISMLFAKSGSLTGNDSEIERYNYFKTQIIQSYGGIKSEETKYFNGKKWYVFTTNDYKNPYSGKYFYNNVYFAFSDSADSIYYFDAYIDSSVSDRSYIADSIEYVIKSAQLYK